MNIEIYNAHQSYLICINSAVHWYISERYDNAKEEAKEAASIAYIIALILDENGDDERAAHWSSRSEWANSCSLAAFKAHCNSKGGE